MPTHQARKRFGQNFLQDQSIIAAIVNAVRPEPADTVIEIGPGLGALTEPLARRLDTLHVCEIDRDIIAYLKQQPFAAKLTIHEGDVLRFDFSSIPGRKKIVGNLPYNISTPLLFRLAETAGQVTDMHFMLQYFFDMEKLLDVPPESFTPAPKVDSAVVRMIPVPQRIGRAEDFPRFAELVRTAFAQRRKTIRNNLKNTAADADLEAAGIAPAMRPEEIPPEKYVALSNYLARGDKAA